MEPPGGDGKRTLAGGMLEANSRAIHEAPPPAVVSTTRRLASPRSRKYALSDGSAATLRYTGSTSRPISARAQRADHAGEQAVGGNAARRVAAKKREHAPQVARFERVVFEAPTDGHRGILAPVGRADGADGGGHSRQRVARTGIAGVARRRQVS